MAYSFPPNPTFNQTYSSNGKTWKWNGVQWASAITSVPSSSAPVYVSVSPPPNPVQGSLWYNSINSDLNLYYVDLNGGQWISVVPYPEDNITQQGGVFEGAIYAQYEIPNNPAAFVTKSWVEDNLVSFLRQGGYMTSGDGVVIDSNTGNIVSIDSGLVV